MAPALNSGSLYKAAMLILAGLLLKSNSPTWDPLLAPAFTPFPLFPPICEELYTDDMNVPESSFVGHGNNFNNYIQTTLTSPNLLLSGTGAGALCVKFRKIEK
jgi:hypothetical protein